ncbi:flavin-containing monooxygenase [Sphaerimonospora sp. CA-214678]|uniref:flavin-containing monooxygenase n=1 Tax=Sphaerimonospora sp. CA-214678 TaxID=3240029 RepID=UPI003D90F39D
MHDVIVVGAGIGGIYAVHRFARQGLSVVGVEGASGVGGVWYHNRYPGARVDLEGIYYSYFDPELYREWTWAERYPSQPELLAYLEFAAERWDVKRRFHFGAWVTGAAFDPAADRYTVTTDTGLTLEGRFLVMATGPLSAARVPDFPGLEEFRGETVLTAQWPHEPVEVDGRRIGVVGTSATGVQVIPMLAPRADHLYVFQRTANYSVPAQNGPADPERHNAHVTLVEELAQRCLEHPGGTDLPLGAGPAASFSTEERTALLERRWAYGGHAMGTVFTDQGTDPSANEVVAEFVRGKIREIVADPGTADKLMPTAYPIGTRRLCVDTGYYQTFNRDNVTLVDIRTDPIERFTETGIQTGSAHYECDLVVFATGFEPFTGSLYKAGIRNAEGAGLADLWARGPQTYLGLQVRGLPNLFIVNGPGSPSVLANFFPTSVQQADFIGDLIAYMARHGHTRVEPTQEAQREWTAHVAEMAAPMLRYRTPNYMVHVNEDDGSRVFIPYPGGFDRHARKCAEVAADGYAGFAFSRTPGRPSSSPMTSMR